MTYQVPPRRPASDLLDSAQGRQRLLAVFTDAFTDEEHVKLLLWVRTGRRLSDFVGAGRPLPIVIAAILVQPVEASDWVPNLVEGACVLFPRHAPLRDLAEEYGWAPPPSAVVAPARLPGLQALVDNAETRELLADSGAALQRVSDTAQSVECLKALHDLVDQLRRTVYVPLVVLHKRFPRDGTTVELVGHLGICRRLLWMILKITRAPGLRESDYLWVEVDLPTAIDCLTTAADQASRPSLGAGLAPLQRVTEGELAKLDQRISDAVADLDLASLVRQLRRVVTRLEASGHQAEAELVRRDVDLLARTDELLQSLTAVHRAWQNLDIYISLVETAISGPSDAISFETIDTSWRLFAGYLAAIQLGPQLKAVVDGRTERFLQARARSEMASLPSRFDELSSALREEFYRVDKALLDEASVVTRLGTGLGLILKQLHG